MPRGPALPDPNASRPQSRAERVAALESLKCQVATCELCPQLAKTRTQTVFGVGNPQPRVVFFGEAPGADEDRQGEPFVGRAGQLLTKIIEAMGFKREDVYILNVLRCRPPENRNPTEEETENCRPWFEATLRVLQPEYIVCVGSVPTKALFPDAASIGKMRGKFYQWNGAKVVCTYHPSYLLRNPEAKKFVWDDMKMLLADMGLEAPKKGT
jgi:uracil-DNA glycosylase family 4